MATLHLICGLPGSGKSTLARQLESSGNAVRFTPDEWLLALGFDLYDEAARARVEQLQWSMARQCLERGADVILENGFWSKAERDGYRRDAERLGARWRLHYLEVPRVELQRRIVARNLALPVAERVDPDDLDKWFAAFEPPSAEETPG